MLKRNALVAYNGRLAPWKAWESARGIGEQGTLSGLTVDIGSPNAGG
jgi:hypothetical protein